MTTPTARPNTASAAKRAFAKALPYLAGLMILLAAFYYFFLGPWLAEMEKAGAPAAWAAWFKNGQPASGAGADLGLGYLDEQAEKFLLAPGQAESLFLNLNQEAARSGLEFSRFKPGALEKREIGYEVLDFELGLKGPFANLLSFLTLLSTREPMVVISRLTLENPKIVSGEMVLEAALKGRVFLKSSANGAPSAGPGGPQ